MQKLLAKWLIIVIAIFILIVAFFGYQKFIFLRYPIKTITIPEGYSLKEIDETLANTGIIEPGEIVGFSPENLDYSFLKSIKPKSLEGFMFPDTYEFYVPSSKEVVVKKFLDNFQNKAMPLIQDSNILEVITLASIIEEEIPDKNLDRRIVAGIFKKRIELNMFIQADATLCYAKEQTRCKGSYSLDRQVDSTYNTYKYKGLPPGPIANPGVSAISAALNPLKSPYLFYISRQDTKETVFAKSLDEHNQNIVKYLK